MLLFIAILLALAPAIAILYPFLHRTEQSEHPDESSLQIELTRRWNAAVAGLRTSELERSIENLSEEDYQTLRHRYMTEAALVIKVMDLEAETKRELLSTVGLQTGDDKRVDG